MRHLPGGPCRSATWNEAGKRGSSGFGITSSADVTAAIEQVAPDVLALLADGVPRNRAAIASALAGRHAKQDVKRTLMRLSIVGRLDMQGSRYTLPAAEAGQG